MTDREESHDHEGRSLPRGTDRSDELDDPEYEQPDADDDGDRMYRLAGFERQHDTEADRNDSEYSEHPPSLPESLDTCRRVDGADVGHLILL